LGGGRGGTSFKSIYEGRQFILFYSFVTLKSSKPRPLLPHFGLIGKPSMSRGACTGSVFIMFQYMVEKVLNIEQNLNKNSFKPKQKFIGEFGCSLGIFRNAPLMSRI
jgi:hypothetical protein